MPFDRAKFFESVEGAFGDLKDSQQDGFQDILGAWEKSYDDKDIRWLAYALATAWHETAMTMKPIAEYGHGRGREYGVPTGPYHQIYYGRSFCMLTWIYNYQKATEKLRDAGLIDDDLDLVKEPDLALRPDIASYILFQGMIEGWFTNRKLSDFFNDETTDPVNARRIINGLDRAADVCQYYLRFHEALRASGS